MSETAAERDGEEVYGTLSVAGAEVALPLAVLREVVPMPEALHALPASTAGLLGAVLLRSLPVPVLDLRAWWRAPDAATPPPDVVAPSRDPDDPSSPDASAPSPAAEAVPTTVIVVIVHDGRVLGLVADGIHTLTSVPRGQVHPTTAADGSLLLSAAFRHPDQGHVVSVLDVAAVFALPGVPAVSDPGPGAVDAVEASSAAVRGRPGTRTVTVLRCGPHVLAVDVQHISTTLPAEATRGSVMSGDLCRGVTDHDGREVPVVDPLALLGLGRMPEPDFTRPSGSGVVLDLGAGYVVLALTAVLDIVDLTAGDVLPLPAFAARRPGLLSGVCVLPGLGQCLVLDGAALHEDEELNAFASVNTAAEEPGGTAAVTLTAAGTGDAGRPATYVTYDAGVDVCTRLEQVLEILPVPADLTDTAVGGAVLGIAVHRGVAVPVLDLPDLLGTGSARDAGQDGCLLLVDAGAGARVAFAVRALRAIDVLSWQEDPAEAAARPPRSSGVLRSSALVGIGADVRLLPDIDLAALAASVTGAPVLQASAIQDPSAGEASPEAALSR